MTKAAAIFFGGYTHTADHPFDDVAVVAKQSSWLAAVMAVICAYLAAFKAAFAYGAFVALLVYQAVDVSLRHAGSSAALTLYALRPLCRVGAEFGISLAATLLIASAAFLTGLRGRILRRASGLDLWKFCSGLSLRSDLVTVRVIVSKLTGLVSIPLFGRAFGLFHTTPLRAGMRVV